MPGAALFMVSLKDLHESPVNPRSHYDPEAMNDLEQSIKTHGVQVPLIVRPDEDGYEIAAGHRRFRAAKTLFLDEVPVIVRSMTDREFLEFVNLENLQREDLHPLDEAQGFVVLMKQAGYTVDRLASRVGKSPKYVYDRIKLLSLAPKARAMFYKGDLTAGQAILLARLPGEEQERCAADGQAMSVRETAARIKSEGLRVRRPHGHCRHPRHHGHTTACRFCCICGVEK